MLEEFQLNNEFNFLLGAKHRYAAYQNNAEIMQILIERIRAIIGGEMPEPVHTAEEKREQSSEKKPDISLVEIPDKTPYCPVCGRELIQKMKPIDGKDEEKIYNRSGNVGAVIGGCIALIYGILFGVTQGGRDAFLFAVGGSYIAAIFLGPIGANIGKLDGEKEVLSLREKKGIDPYLLYCKKCKKQFSRREE